MTQCYHKPHHSYPTPFHRDVQTEQKSSSYSSRQHFVQDILPIEKTHPFDYLEFESLLFEPYPKVCCNLPHAA